MKLLSLFAAAFATASAANQKGVCMGGYVKDFSVYMDCTEILGYLAIVGSSETDLSKLSKIRTIKPFNNMKGPNGAAIYIANNQNLKNVDGINGIKIIQGDMVIEGNAGLVNANLDKIEVAGDIEVKKNPVLKNVVLGNKAGGVVIEDNAALVRAKILFGQIKGALKVVKNGKLNDFQAAALEKIGNNAAGDALVIDGNDRLTNLNGLSALKGLLTGAVSISNNKALLNMDALKNVQALGTDKSGQSLTISMNGALNDIMGFSGLKGKTPGGISITGNPSLTVLAGFQKVSEIGTNLKGNALEVSSNAALKDFLGFSGVKQINGALVVKNNKNLISMEGLTNLKNIEGTDTNGNSLILSFNSKLIATKLNQLVKAKGGIVIENNPNLNNVVDFVSGLKQVNNLLVKDVKCMSPAEVLALKNAAKGARKIEAANAASCLKGAVTVGSGQGTICGGTSGGKWADWSMLGSTGLYMDVSTKSCKFKGHPNYVSSIAGDSAHWQLTGVNSVYKATNTGFRVYVWHPVLRGKFMQFFAMKYNWKLTWLADTGVTSGRTAAGATGWKAVPHTKNVIYADVPTTQSGFKTTPRYISSIHGGAHHWKVTGAHAIYKASPKGFRVYLVYPVALTPKFAELNQWAVAYVGSEDTRTSGQSTSNWKAYTTDSSKKALYIDVDSSKGYYTKTPTYVTSLSGGSHHWMVTGAGAVYSAGPKSFRVYLDNAQTAVFAKENKWRVNYIAHSDKVNCVMSKWSKWTGCSKSCGTGANIRVRQMITRAYYGGKCASTTASKACNTHRCPTDCKIGAWTPFSKCSKTCGNGFKTRSRKASKLAKFGGKACGMLEEVIVCQAGACPRHCEVTNWSAFSTCSKTCGTGNQLRTRTIVSHPAWGGFQCPRLYEAQQCNTALCPIDCTVSAYSPYGACTKTCGTGKQTRTRIVTKAAANGGKACATPLSTTRTCAKGKCPVHCSVTAWTAWTTCTKTCGGGVQSRKRKVVRKAAAAGTVCPDLFDKRQCKTLNCPIHCVASVWSKYSSCSVSCGGGSMTRTRSVVTKAHYGGKMCGIKQEKVACNEKACPVDCVMEEWAAWSACDKSCGRGNQKRARDVFTPARNGGKACPILTQERPCTVSVCPVHCWVSGWSTWSICSQTCGVGKSSRVRNIVQQSKYGGTTCPALKEAKECMSEKCPVDCVVSDWRQWSTCTKTCTEFGSNLKGKQSHTRKVLRVNAYGGKVCPHKYETRDCGTNKCPINCAVSAFGAMSVCSVTCGTGTQFQTRKITTQPRFKGIACPSLIATSTCDAGACPVHCTVSSWGAYGLCTKSCGGGEKTRFRHVVTEASSGGVQCPSLQQKSACNLRLCPINCKVSKFGTWGICSKTCGGGSQKALRKRTVFALNGGKSCPALSKSRACNPQACPIDCRASAFGSFTKCTKTCGTGSQSRKRALVTAAQFGGRVCPVMSQTRKCSVNKCPIHCDVSKWGAYGACTKTCGTGEKTRARTIVKLPNHGGTICPKLSDSSKCNTQACPINCKLSKWSAWSAATGNKLSRTRTIKTYPSNGGKKCAALVQVKVHTAVTGCKDAVVYGKWSECTKKCNTGYRYRFWERVTCSSSSTLKTHLQMRQGEHCNTKACANAADGATVIEVFVPPITGYQRNKKGVPTPGK